MGILPCGAVYTVYAVAAPRELRKPQPPFAAVYGSCIGHTARHCCALQGRDSHSSGHLRGATADCRNTAQYHSCHHACQPTQHIHVGKCRNIVLCRHCSGTFVGSNRHCGNYRPHKARHTVDRQTARDDNTLPRGRHCRVQLVQARCDIGK